MRFFNSFLILLVFLGVESKSLNYGHPSVPVIPPYYPNFSKPVTILPQGTSVLPICSFNSHSACFNQWTSQAMPLSIQQGDTRQFNYFIPSFVPEVKLPSDSVTKKGWKKSTYSRENDFGKRTFYFNETNPERVRMVDINSEGVEVSTEGSVLFLNVNDLKEYDSNRTIEIEDAQPSEERAESSDATTESLRSGPVQQPNDSPDSNESSYRSYQVSRDTIALPASRGSEVKPGCFRVNKMEVETQAAFCFECIRNNSENAYFNSLLKQDSLLSKLQTLFKTTQKMSVNKIEAQITGSLSGDGETQICSPVQRLSAIIKNFESKCPPYNQKGKGFKRFFKETLCKSREKGVPVELMMGMMSVESSGKCTARNTDGENSSGLFQVDSNQHICKKGYKKGTERNARCLSNIHNNWDKSIEILSTFYKNTNGKELEKPSKDWLDMEPKDRNAFRRAVAGYNGGYWFLNATRVAKNNTKKDKSKYGLAYKHDKSTWEEIRAFYFVQHLKRNSKYTRRSLKNDLSNLAHTEAILGREVKNSVPGMVEIWAQYKREFVQQNPTQCQPLVASLSSLLQ